MVRTGGGEEKKIRERRKRVSSGREQSARRPLSYYCLFFKGNVCLCILCIPFIVYEVILAGTRLKILKYHSC